MGNQVIAARDVDIWITFPNYTPPIIYKLVTSSDFSINISGNTEDIGAISTDEPIATDNGGTTYDISFSLQQGEAIDIKDALAVATKDNEGGSISHIRQVIEEAAITVVWHKKRGTSPLSSFETYNKCTGVSEDDAVARRSTETLKSWKWRSLGMTRTTGLYVP